jgi:hydroxymethylbilane synthase
VAALAQFVGENVHFRGQIFAEDGSEMQQGAFTGPLAEAPAAIAALAARLLGQAGPALRGLFTA